jgi:hypothetical protein
MDLFHVALLLIAGVIGGTISTVIGGASIITFPVLLATGIPPVTAVISNTVALVPGNLVATVYDRAQLPPLGRPFVGLVAASVSGALMGAVLLLLTPERAFEILVPLLLGFATCCSPIPDASPPGCEAGRRRRLNQSLTVGRRALARCFRCRFTAAILERALGFWCLASSRSVPQGIIAPPTS